MRTKILAAVGAVALCSLSVVYGATAYARHYFPYYEIEYVRKDVMGHTAASGKINTMRDSFFEAYSDHADVVMIGDSITNFGEWSEILPGVVVKNRGISGDTTRDVLARMAPILAIHPRQAFVMIGINDIYEENATAQDVFANYRLIVSQLRSANIRVTVLSTLYKSASAGGRNDRIKELNSLLKSYCQTVGAEFTDANVALAPGGALRDDFTVDGTHLNGAGYKALGSIVRTHISG